MSLNKTFIGLAFALMLTALPACHKTERDGRSSNLLYQAKYNSKIEFVECYSAGQLIYSAKNIVKINKSEATSSYLFENSSGEIFESNGHCVIKYVAKNN